jgi:DNA-directed RNA polymerase subunit RPC12/RpoP
METSRGTLQRMLVSGRKKVADALINGKKIVIEGGNYSISECVYKCTACGNRFTRLEGKTDSKNNLICPLCGSKEYFCEKTKKFCLHKCNQHKEDAK